MAGSKTEIKKEHAQTTFSVKDGEMEFDMQEDCALCLASNAKTVVRLRPMCVPLAGVDCHSLCANLYNLTCTLNNKKMQHLCT